MPYEVIFSSPARTDIAETSAYVWARFGPVSAARYVLEVTKFCEALADFPQQGRRRDDIEKGLRTIAFHRKAVIGFAIRDRQVIILRIWNKGREMKP